MYSQQLKELVLQKRLEKLSLPKIASQLNLSLSTVRFWVYRTPKGTSMNISSKEKQCDLVLEYLSLPESERGAFLRTNGLFEHQIQDWVKEAFLSKTINESKNIKKLEKELEQKSKELNRKDKALHETHLLLGLQKKILEYAKKEEKPLLKNDKKS